MASIRDVSPPDPTDPAAKHATIEHLRDLIANHHPPQRPNRLTATEADSDHQPQHGAGSRGIQGGPATRKAEPSTHEEWVEFGREVALRQLGFSARSSHQLREAMAAREVPGPARDEVIDRLTRVGLIDDAQYAAMLVRTRQAERGLARRALMVELTRKGIDPDTAAMALEQVDEQDEAEAARRLIRKRVASMRTLDPTKRRNRLYATLARRGYSASAARAAIDEVLTEKGLELY